MSSLIGKSLQGGKYKLETVLGKGGFGLTFRAHQTYLDQVVVIKTLNEDYWQAPNLSDLQGQFQDEARRLALCSHPNVVRVSDFFIEDSLPYMVMDYIPGRSLYDIVIPGNPLPVKAATSYITQIGRALQAVHAKGLLHRDVKPQNIMIHELTGDAILIDFGIARELSQNPAQTHTSIVSEGYAPIEQYLPKAHRSAATDIYGLAATLYTLLTAEIPTAAVLRDRAPLIPIRELRPDVKPSMADAIAQGMNIELRDRPQSVGRWLTMLTQKSSLAPTGNVAASQTPTGRTLSQRPRSEAPYAYRPSPNSPSPYSPSPYSPQSAPAPTPSEYPTRVVAPAGYASYAPNTATNTVAYPPEQKTAVQHSTPYAPRKRSGCLPSLGFITLLIAGAFAAGGYWLINQLAETTTNLPRLELPEELPEIELPEVELPEVELPDITLPRRQTEDSADSAESETEAETTDNTPETEPTPVPNPPVNNAAQPPLVLANSGANPNPGNLGDPVPVPGFAPGAQEDSIRSRLGAPTRENSQNGFYTSTYRLDSSRATLGFVYDENSTQLLQSEAAFSPNADKFIMQSALLGMLDNRAPASVIDGLEAVRTQQRDRVDISTGSFTGAIERNANGYIHIYVR